MKAMLLNSALCGKERSILPVDSQLLFVGYITVLQIKKKTGLWCLYPDNDLFSWFKQPGSGLWYILAQEVEEVGGLVRRKTHIACLEVTFSEVCKMSRIL